MKLTAITGPKGELVAVVYGHLSEYERQRPTDGPYATVVPMRGQKFHELSAPDEYAAGPRQDVRNWVAKQIEHRKKATKKR